jgi:phage gp16-like protein
MTQAVYERAIRTELRNLEKLAQSVMTLHKVVQILAPLEAHCARSRCMGTNTCSHLRVEVLALLKRPGSDTELPYTAIFQPGEDPESPLLMQGWNA